MSRTNDDTDHLRALLADATARAEKAEAEAEVRSGRWCEKNRNEGRGGCGMCGWCCKQSREQRDAALDACAGMRAAMQNACAVFENGGGMGHEVARFCALLSRPDLGAGKVLVEREVLERARQIIKDDGYDGDADIIVDLDALLKKGGG